MEARFSRSTRGLFQTTFRFDRMRYRPFKTSPKVQECSPEQCPSSRQILRPAPPASKVTSLVKETCADCLVPPAVPSRQLYMHRRKSFKDYARSWTLYTYDYSIHILDHACTFQEPGPFQTQASVVDMYVAIPLLPQR